MVGVEPTSRAEEVLRRVKQEYGEVYILLGDTGCCGYSNVFLTTLKPESGYEYLGEYEGIEIYIHPSFKKAVSGENIRLDAVEVEVDDSFSLETNLGYRLILKPLTEINI